MCWSRSRKCIGAIGRGESFPDAIVETLLESRQVNGNLFLISRLFTRGYGLTNESYLSCGSQQGHDQPSKQGQNLSQGATPKTTHHVQIQWLAL